MFLLGNGTDPYVRWEGGIKVMKSRLHSLYKQMEGMVGNVDPEAVQKQVEEAGGAGAELIEVRYTLSCTVLCFCIGALVFL